MSNTWLTRLFDVSHLTAHTQTKDNDKLIDFALGFLCPCPVYGRIKHSLNTFPAPSLPFVKSLEDKDVQSNSCTFCLWLCFAPIPLARLRREYRARFGIEEQRLIPQIKNVEHEDLLLSCIWCSSGFVLDQMTQDIKLRQQEKNGMTNEPHSRKQEAMAYAQPVQNDHHQQPLINGGNTTYINHASTVEPVVAKPL